MTPDIDSYDTGARRRMRLLVPILLMSLSAVSAPGPASSADAVLSDTVYAAVHPRLLFAPADIPGLYNKVRDGGQDDIAYVFIRNRVDNDYSPLSIQELLGDHYGLQQIPNLAMAAFLESPYDTTSLVRGKELTLLIADSLDVDTDPYASALRLRSLALGYDWFFADATEAERAVVRDEVVAYLNFMLTSVDYDIWHYRPYTSNKAAMVAGAMGLASIAFEVELPAGLADAARAEADQFVQDWMDTQLDSDGACREGLLYGLWSMRHLIYYFEARRRYDGYDYSLLPAIRNLEDWLAYEIDPRGQGHTNNIQDCTDFYRSMSRHTTYLNWAQSRWNSGVCAYLYLHGPGGFGINFGDEADKAGTVLWWQPNPVTDPGVTVPDATLFRGRGLYYYRTGWPLLFDSDDVVFSFYSGVFEGGHAQEDQNQFTLTAFRDKLVTDHGAGSIAKESEAHNMVFIDGAGQHNAGSSIGTDGKIASYIIGDYMDVLVGDATAAYTTYSPYNENDYPFPGIDWSWGHVGANPVDHALRTVVAVHDAELPAYFIIADDIEKDGGVHTYAWRLHTDEENTVDDSANPVHVTGATGSMEVYAVNPSFDSLSTSVTYFDNGNVDDNSYVLSLDVDAVDPQFVNLLLPRSTSSSPPVVATTRSAEGTQTTLDWGSGYTDVVVTAVNGGPWGDPPGGITTDARLAVARFDGTTLVRFLMVDGTTLAFDGVTRVSVIDGAASVSASDGAIYLDRDDADFAVYSPSDVPVYFHGATVPASRVGDYLVASALTAAPGDGAAPGPPISIRAYPNPFNPDVRVTLTVAAPADNATAEVYDVSGRRVARVWSGRLAAGENHFRWNGLDAGGHRVATGVYFLRVRAGTSVATTKLTVLK